MKPLHLPSLSIIFPNLNGNKKDLVQLFQSIQNSNYPKEMIEVILVDNGSKNELLNGIKNITSMTRIKKMTIIKNKTNLGFAKAVNQGVNKSVGEYLFITNNDIVLEKNCLNNLIRFLLKQPNVGIVGGKTYRKYTHTIIHPAPHYNFYTGLFHDAKDPQKTQQADWIPGSGFCCSKNLFEKLGGFDEEFFFTYEDFDFCLRAKRKGYQVIYYPKAVLWHRDGATINKKEFAFFKYYQGYRGKLRLLIKHASLLQILTSFLLQFFIFAPYRRLVLGEKSFIPLLHALFWNSMHLSQTLTLRKNIYAPS